MITDAERRHLHDQAEQAMGEEAANTLMGYLPPVGWQDVATKTDLKVLEAQFAQVRSEMAAMQSALESKIDKSHVSMVRTYFIGTIGLVVALASVPQIAERLFG